MSQSQPISPIAKLISDIEAKPLPEYDGLEYRDTIRAITQWLNRPLAFGTPEWNKFLQMSSVIQTYGKV